jgi:hypothetical protein
MQIHYDKVRINCEFSSYQDTNHVCVKAHPDIAEHEVVEHNVLKPEIVDGHQHWDHEANGNNQLQPAYFQLEILANEKVLVNGKDGEEKVADIAGVVEHSPEQTARKQRQTRLNMREGKKKTIT